MPCDNFSNTVNQENVDVNAIELIINSEDWMDLLFVVILTHLLAVIMHNQHA